MNILQITLTIFYSLVSLSLILFLFFGFKLYRAIKKVEREWNNEFLIDTPKKKQVKKTRKKKVNKPKGLKQSDITMVGKEGMRINLGQGRYIYDKKISDQPGDETD